VEPRADARVVTGGGTRSSGWSPHVGEPRRRVPGRPPRVHRDDVGFSTDATGSSSPEDECVDEDSDARRSVRWSNLLAPPESLVLGDLAGTVRWRCRTGWTMGTRRGPRTSRSWRWPCGWWRTCRGLLARRDRAPTLAVFGAVLFVPVLSLLWVNIDSYSTSQGQVL
jgi:cellulose synthase A